MDKIEKFLRKLRKSERAHIARVLQAILSGSFESLDIKRLKGKRQYYRIRVGDIRIIFTFSGADYYVISIDRRSEKTYKDL